MNNKTQYAYIFIILSTLIFSFYFKIDISNGGASRDLYYHWEYIVGLKSSLGILMQDNLLNQEPYPKHFPLHHIIVSKISFLSNDLDNYLNFYFIFSLFLPVLFYRCLIIKYENINNMNK